MARQLEFAEAMSLSLCKDIADTGKVTVSTGVGADRDGLFISIGLGPDALDNVSNCISARQPGLRVKFFELGGFPAFSNTAPPQTGQQARPVIPEQLPMRPLCCGAEISISNSSRPGSLGCFVIHDVTQAKGFVSCSHVLHPTLASHERDDVMQPVSAQPNSRVVGKVGPHIPLIGLARGRKPLPTELNEADIGFARIPDGAEIPQRPRVFHAWHNGLDFNGGADPFPGNPVFKVGRNGVTRGVVHQVLVRTPVGLNPNAPNPMLYWFSKVFTIRSVDASPFSEPGDSGALVVREDDNNALGMIFAVTPRLAYAFPLDAGLTAAQCQLL